MAAFTRVMLLMTLIAAAVQAQTAQDLVSPELRAITVRLYPAFTLTVELRSGPLGRIRTGEASRFITPRPDDELLSITCRTASALSAPPTATGGLVANVTRSSTSYTETSARKDTGGGARHLPCSLRCA